MTASSHALLSSLVSALDGGRIRVVDLTQTLSEETPVLVLPPPFGQCAPFSRDVISRYDERGVAWYWSNFTVGEHTGTHFDAPVHWVTGKDLPNNATDQLPAQHFVAPAAVFDCARQAAENPDFLLDASDILAWESRHGRIPPKSWALLRTDWSKRPVDAYTNRRADGAHTPGPNVAAMRFLIEERDILGFGVETIGTDAGQAHLLEPAYPAHTLLHGAGKYGLQCLENLDLLPPTGAVLVAAPAEDQGRFRQPAARAGFGGGLGHGGTLVQGGSRQADGRRRRSVHGRGHSGRHQGVVAVGRVLCRRLSGLAHQSFDGCVRGRQ